MTTFNMHTYAHQHCACHVNQDFIYFILFYNIKSRRDIIDSRHELVFYLHTATLGYHS